MELTFFDCSTYIGLPAVEPRLGPAGAPVDADGLIAEMDRAGIARALVWHVAQRDHDVATGNQLLAEAIGPHERLLGCWSLLPPQTHELGDADELLRAAADAGVKAFRAWPKTNRYLLRGEAMGEVLERMIAARMPLILSLPEHVEWANVYDLLAEMPELTVILADLGCWGQDRFFRPLIERYPNVYVELSGYFVDGGIEAFVGDYGARRLLFGTRFPECYHGANMLMLAHAEISDADKQAVAAGNLEKLIAEVKL